MRLALGTRILLLVVLSPTVISLALGTWLFVSRLQAVQLELERRGEILISQLALASQNPFTLGDRKTLGQISTTALLDPSVSEISFETAQGQPLLETRQDRSTASPLPSWVTERFLNANAGRQRQFRALILPSAPILQFPTTLDVGQHPVGWIRLVMSPDHLLHQQMMQTAQVAGILLTFLTLTLTLGLWTRREVTGPLRQLTTVVRRLGAGDLRARVGPLSSGEVGELARAINRTAISMERSQRELSQQIEQATQELRQTLESVEIQNVELDIARKRALVGSRVKSEFLANMSHEIRTPINGILGFSDLLSHSRLDEEQQDYVVTIKESCANLLSLVNDILDFSKMEAGKLVIDNIAFDLRDCVEEVLSLMAPAAYGKSLELIHLIYKDVPLKLFGDPIRIRQILTNLVHNSIKFTPRGRVVVRVMLEDESDNEAVLRVTVTDTGIGLSTADKNNLFKAFGQADTSITRRFGGAGLGLIICQKLLQQMGGDIGLESQPDQGSTFWFTLRCATQPESKSNKAPPSSDSPLRDQNILIYDENVLSRLATRHILEFWGMRVEEVEKQEAFVARLIGAEHWDMALFGLTRAELNARHFHNVMSGLPAIDVPLIVLASTVDRNELRNLYQQGARVCLPKAARRQTLYREMCRLITTQAVKPLTIPDRHCLPAASSLRTQQQFPGARILVADDNEINRKLVTTILNRCGVLVEQAADGQQALNMASKVIYDVIFMDIHMPVMSGEWAAALIREQQYKHQGNVSRIVALTANALPGERERLMSMSMDECLIKPVTQQQVLEQLRIALSAIAETASDEVINPEREKSLTDELRAMLISELPAHKRAIQQAYGQGDLIELREQVHRLHGAASVCQVPELNDACRELENALIRNRRIEIPRGVEKVLAGITALLNSA